MIQRKRLAASSAAAAILIATSIALAGPAAAASGCSVAYAVQSQWPGGFTANVTLENLGDPITSWTLAWSYAAGQRVTQPWNATATQSGAAVTVKNVGHNGSIATNATTSFGFNGAWSGSNPAPTQFTLNGVTCTGGASGSPSPTPPSSSPSPSPTSVPPTSPPGVPSDARWVASGQWSSWSNNGYDLNNDVWGSGAGPQTIWARSGSNWGVVANHSRTSGIKSYPHTGKSINRRLSSLRSLNTSFNVSVPGDGDYSTTYDLWADNHAYEIMIWMNWRGKVGPIASRYDQNGAVPDARNVTVGGHTWNIYRGSNGSNAVFSFLRTSQTNSGSMDLLAMMNWLRSQGWWGDVTFVDAQFGFEITGTTGQSNFVSNDLSVGFS